jgi:hypothetical protein
MTDTTHELVDPIITHYQSSRAVKGSTAADAGTVPVRSGRTADRKYDR